MSQKGLTMIAITFIALLGLSIWSVNDRGEEDLPKDAAARNPKEQQADTKFPESVKDKSKEAAAATTLRFKGRTIAHPEPNPSWSFGARFFTVYGDMDYEVVEKNSHSVKIRQGPRTGWVHRWYVAESEDPHRITALAPFEMVVREPARFYAYPDQEAPAGFELEQGKVVQVQARYGDWYEVEFQLYAEPMAGNRWMHKNSLVEYDDKLAKEGFMRFADGGSVLYADREGTREKRTIDYKTTVMIKEEYDDMYAIGAPGGTMGYIKKEDFVPNPFSLREGTFLEWSPSVDEVFNRYNKSREDHDLQGVTPVDVFKMYQHAAISDNGELMYDLLFHDPSYEIPSIEEYLSDREKDRVMQRKNTLAFARRASETEVKTQYRENEAYVTPVHPDDGDWFFRLIRNEDGVWKVSWLAMQ